MPNEVLDIIAKSKNGKFLTWPDIEQSIDSFRVTLYNPDELYNSKSLIFNNLLRHIYNNNIRQLLPETGKHDYKLLDNIFYSIYLRLCYNFNHVPSVNNYCIHLINIDISNIYNIRTGLRYDNAQGSNRELQTFVCKWDEACNSDLIDYVVQTSSIGGIFRAKTKGFKEEQTIRIETDSSAPRIDTKQLQTLAQSDQEPQQITENNGFELPPDD